MKAHSERVPNKNMRMLAGKPLFNWILESLSQVRFIADIVINTDSEEIMQAAKQHFDVVIHERPNRIRGDFVSMNDIIADDLSRLANYDWFLQTHATNPFLKPDSIERAVDRLFSSPDFDSLFSVTRIQGRVYSENHQAINHDPSELIRTQDLSPLYLENSNLYIFSRASFQGSQNRIGAHPILHEISAREALDIDTEDDWYLAEHVATKELSCAQPL